MTSPLCGVHGDVLMLAVRTCYNVALMSSHSPATHTACKAAITQILSLMFAKLEQVGGGGREEVREEEEEEEGEEGEGEVDELDDVSAMLLAKSLVGSVFQSLGLHVDARRGREGEDTVEREEREEKIREKGEREEKEKEKEKRERERKKLEMDTSSPFHATPLGEEEKEEKDEGGEKKKTPRSSLSSEERPSKDAALKSEEKEMPIKDDKQKDEEKETRKKEDKSTLTPPPSSTPLNGTSHPNGSIAKAPPSLPDIAPELAAAPNADAIPTDEPSVVFHDCFLIFRALCKLSIKDVLPLPLLYDFEFHFFSLFF